MDELWKEPHRKHRHVLIRYRTIGLRRVLCINKLTISQTKIVPVSNAKAPADGITYAHV